MSVLSKFFYGYSSKNDANSLTGNKRTDSLPFHNHDLNPTFFLPRSAMIEPDIPAIVHKSSDNVRLSYSYREFADMSLGLAYYLKKNQKKYKVVAFIMTNTPSFLISIFGVGAAGAVASYLNYRLRPVEIHYMLDLIKADLVLIDNEFLELVRDYKPNNGRNVDIVIDYDLGDAFSAPKGDFYSLIKEGFQYNFQNGNQGWDALVAQGIPEDSTISLAFTSGTTGKPKAVEYTNRNMYLVSLCNAMESGIFDEGNQGHKRCKYLWTLPLFHACGWTFPYGVTAVRGTHVCLRKIDTAEIWKLLDEENITHFCAAPTVNTLICNDKNARRLKQSVRVIVAASPPSATLFKQMISYNFFPVHVYGLTETFGPFTKGYFRTEWKELLEKGDDRVYELMARQGYAFSISLNARVVKEDVFPLEDVKCDGSEIGEIVIRGNTVMKGYYRDPKATEKAFKGGWFHSGDLAVMYPDKSIKVVDRGKDIIISGGENISSVAVESEIMKFPGVLECAVVAIADEKYGERPKAYITIREDNKDSFNVNELFTYLKKNMGGFQVPKELEVIKELPKTSTGKIRKNVLRDLNKQEKAKL